jgi:hypothetical protein
MTLAVKQGPDIPSMPTLAAMAVTAAGLSAVYVLAAADAGRTDGFSGLLRFREDGRGVEVYGLALVVGFSATVVLLVGSFVSAGENRLVMQAGNLAAKLTLLAAAVFMFVFSDLPQFEAKSLTYRAVLYPLLALMFPVTYVVRGRGHPYPGMMDLCLTFAVTFDIVSNDLHYYGTWKDWDDLVHFFNSLPIMVVIVIPILALELQGHLRLGLWLSLLFGLTIYASIHALWEMSEFLLDEFAGTNLQPGGMAEATGNNLSSLGGAVVALAMIWWWDARGNLKPYIVLPLASLMGSSGVALSGRASGGHSAVGEVPE